MDLQAKSDRAHASNLGSEQHFVRLTFEAPELQSTSERGCIDVGLVLDRSGSMGGGKFCTAREAVDSSLRLLRPADRFTLVVFDDRIDTLAPLCEANREAVDRTKRALAGIHARGGTDLEGGWSAAARELAHEGPRTRSARAVLITDGHANQGMSNPDQLIARAAQLRRQGIRTSAFGIGADFEEELLRAIALNGGGNFYYVEQVAQLRDVLASEFGETLAVTLREASVRVRVPVGAQIELLDEHLVERHDGSLEIKLGDLTSRQQVQLTFAVTLPMGVIGQCLAVGFDLTGGEPNQTLGSTQVVWDLCSPQEAEAQVRDEELEATVAELLVARGREHAYSFNRRGQYSEASASVGDIHHSIAEMASRNMRVAALQVELDEERALIGEPMGAAELKRREFLAYTRRRGRDAQGRIIQRKE